MPTPWPAPQPTPQAQETKEHDSSQTGDLNEKILKSTKEIRKYIIYLQKGWVKLQHIIYKR